MWLVHSAEWDSVRMLCGQMRATKTATARTHTWRFSGALDATHASHLDVGYRQQLCVVSILVLSRRLLVLENGAAAEVVFWYLFFSANVTVCVLCSNIAVLAAMDCSDAVCTLQNHLLHYLYIFIYNRIRVNGNNSSRSSSSEPERTDQTNAHSAQGM